MLRLHQSRNCSVKINALKLAQKSIRFKKATNGFLISYIKNIINLASFERRTRSVRRFYIALNELSFLLSSFFYKNVINKPFLHNIAKKHVDPYRLL